MQSVGGEDTVSKALEKSVAITTVWSGERFWLKATCNILDYGKKGCGGGVKWAETMLGVR